MSDYWNYLTGNGAPPNPWGGTNGPQFPPATPGMTLNSPPPMTSANIPPPDGSVPTAMPSTPVPPPMNPVDRDTLIKTVAGEAGSEPIAGQAAVAHVILNRLAAGGYGNSITDIAKAPLPGRDGQLGYHEFSMWNPPNKQGNKGASLDPASDAYARIGDVVDKAYYGGMPDPTGGATHYYAGAPPRQWPQDWFNSQPKVKVGSQVFVGGAGGPGQRPTVVGALGGGS